MVVPHWMPVAVLRYARSLDDPPTDIVRVILLYATVDAVSLPEPDVYPLTVNCATVAYLPLYPIVFTTWLSKKNPIL